jgi:hypothetical protein
VCTALLQFCFLIRLWTLPISAPGVGRMPTRSSGQREVHRCDWSRRDCHFSLRRMCWPVLLQRRQTEKVVRSSTSENQINSSLSSPCARTHGWDALASLPRRYTQGRRLHCHSPCLRRESGIAGKKSVTGRVNGVNTTRKAWKLLELSMRSGIFSKRKSSIGTPRFRTRWQN